jgi:hypothetical protein
MNENSFTVEEVLDAVGRLMHGLSSVAWTTEELEDHGLTPRLLDRIKLLATSVGGEADVHLRGGSETTVGL